MLQRSREIKRSLITCQVKKGNKQSHPFSLTLWSGGHYRGAVSVSGVWNDYDGLWERNRRGQGLGKCTGKAFHSQWLPTLPLCLHPQKAVTLNYNP